MKFRVIVADPPWSFLDSLKMSDVARGASSNYQVMTNYDIEQLPVKDFISPTGSILALWVPSSLLQEGLNTMKAWGFAHKQTYVWVKTKKDPFINVRKVLNKRIASGKELFKCAPDVFPLRSTLRTVFDGALHKVKDVMLDTLAFGMGRLFRQTHEICLIGTSDSKIYKGLKNKSQRSVSFAPNLKHSSKPEDLQNSLEIMFPSGSRLEMFARRHRPGWTCLGNEICNGEDIRDSLAKLKITKP